MLAENVFSCIGKSALGIRDVNNRHDFQFRDAVVLDGPPLAAGP